MKIAVTGSTGFIGRALCKHLTDSGFFVVGIARRRPKLIPHCGQFVVSDSYEPGTLRLNGVDTIIHLAALAHGAAIEASESELQQVNVEFTSMLVKHALDSKVRRFIFLSSIGVNGDKTYGLPFDIDSIPAPHNEYAESKYRSEKSIENLCQKTNMDYVILRPPLVYGCEVKGNFLSMLKWLVVGIPLPLGAIRNNQRSFIYIENLTDLISVCIKHPSAANQIFLISDDEDLSTVELLRRTSSALGKKVRLLWVPLRFFNLAGKLLGKSDVGDRLAGSLKVDISHTKKTLDWSPPYSVDYGLRKTAEWYTSSER